MEIREVPVQRVGENVHHLNALSKMIMLFDFG